MKMTSKSFRARVNLLIATTIAFAFGLGLASALDLTPLSIAASDRIAPTLVIGATDAPDVTLSGGFADMIERVRPAVVTVWSWGEAPQRPRAQLPPGFELPDGIKPPAEKKDPGEPALERWSGSGFVISSDGYVLTNNHVVQGAQFVNLELADKRVFENVEVVGRDPQTDVALLKIDAKNLPVTPLGDSEDTRVGEWVLAIGSPGVGSLGGPLETTVTAGIVSAKGRNIRILRQGGAVPLAIEDFIQTDAVINRGNSGGPLVNAAGEVVGINTAIASTSGSYQGYGFAVPIELAREVIDDLVEFGEVRRALIGVGINDVNSADAKFYGLDRVAGAKVGSFSDIDGNGSNDDSPALQAGIEIGDVIVGVAGEPVDGVSDLQRKIRGYEPGDAVGLDIVRRRTREHEVAKVHLAGAGEPAPVLLAAANDEATRFDASNPLEIEVSDISHSLRSEYRIPRDIEGVVVVDGEARGPVGLLFGGTVPDGTVITDLNGTSVSSLEDYQRALGDLKRGEAASMIIQFDVDPRESVSSYTLQIVSVILPHK